MYTSILLVALSGVAAAEELAAPSWVQDYSAAKKQAAKEKKPLAVFLAPGKASWDKIGRDGGLGSEAKRLLSDNYICVHVDTATKEGRRLAEAFEIPDGLGIVISDRTADLQAFRHEGDLANADVTRYLRRYADPNLVVRVTESNPGHRERGYSYGAPAYAPVQSYPIMGGGYCPTCGGCAGGRCRR
jgi:hypothetical protein